LSSRLHDYDYHLPENLIAAYPLQHRDSSRVLLLDRKSGEIRHKRFKEIPDLVRPGDVVVVNNVRVIPARIEARRPGGGKVEILLVERREQEGAVEERWTCLINPSRRLRSDLKLTLPGGFTATYAGPGTEKGTHVIDIAGPGIFMDMLMEKGRVPLPPYIIRRRGSKDEPLDRERYQTVYARTGLAVAAPTAGLHFTRKIMAKIEEKALIREITLDVGPGTFLPVRTEDIRQHDMHSERYHIPKDTAETITEAKNTGKRVVAVGTTVVRTLESAWKADNSIRAGADQTRLFIYPGYEFHVVDALLTNFHLPKSTLLMLVSAFAGRESILEAYKQAIKQGYRFYSYGDAMFIA